MRGKGTEQLHAARSFGITPAYAGKSFGVPLLDSGIKDHPRLCGEKAVEKLPPFGK